MYYKTIETYVFGQTIKVEVPCTPQTPYAELIVLAYELAITEMQNKLDHIK